MLSLSLYDAVHGPDMSVAFDDLPVAVSELLSEPLRRLDVRIRCLLFHLGDDVAQLAHFLLSDCHRGPQLFESVFLRVIS